MAEIYCFISKESSIEWALRKCYRQEGRRKEGRKEAWPCAILVLVCTLGWASECDWLFLHVQSRVCVNLDICAQCRSGVQKMGAMKATALTVSLSLPSQLHLPSLHLALPSSCHAIFCKSSYIFASFHLLLAVPSAWTALPCFLLAVKFHSAFQSLLTPHFFPS